MMPLLLALTACKAEPSQTATDETGYAYGGPEVCTAMCGPGPFIDLNTGELEIGPRFGTIGLELW